MKKLLPLLAVLIFACQSAPHTEREYNYLINTAQKEKADTIWYMQQNHVTGYTIREIQYDHLIDSLTKERNRYYKD